MPREPRHEFDRAYIERLAAGDPETERHFTEYFGQLLSIKLRSRLRSPALIDDAKQETFLRGVKVSSASHGRFSAPLPNASSPDSGTSTIARPRS